MKKIFLVFAITSILFSCKTTSPHISALSKEEIQVDINLINIKSDKVLVTIKSPKIKTDEVTFHIPKTIPGTYSEDNYGRYIEDLKAFDTEGKLLNVKKADVNSWSIGNAKKLDKITYLVNDTFDTEKGTGFGGEDIFSPSGSNIEEGKNILLNTHCFVGYFSDYLSVPYKVIVSHPADLLGATSMTDLDPSTSNDLFLTSRYAEFVENPIMYSKPDYTKFTVDNMEILIAVYSPTGKVTAQSITPEMKTMISAQKHFLGNINTTKKYSVLLYLSKSKKDATQFGALEHPTATTVVFPETVPLKELIKSMIDVVSHEFFHILTPLSIHSKEIQDFDYSAPKMSKHLWMYEGVTEYFSVLFQINQGLIDEDEFLSRITEKIDNASNFNDTMPFTKMSANVLLEPYKDQYLNVYEKGALIGMCLDIIIRENSNGKRSILDLMQKLSNEYGVSKAFNDEDLFAKITELTYPEVGEFLETYVSGSTPIPYETYLAKVGVKNVSVKKSGNIFEKNKEQYISLNYKNEIIVNPKMKLNDFFINLGIVGGDIILEVNNKIYSRNKANEILYDCDEWKENDTISLKIRRNGIEQIINGTVKLPYEEIDVLKAIYSNKFALKKAWLKG